METLLVAQVSNRLAELTGEYEDNKGDDDGQSVSVVGLEQLSAASVQTGKLYRLTSGWKSSRTDGSSTDYIDYDSLMHLPIGQALLGCDDPEYPSLLRRLINVFPGILAFFLLNGGGSGPLMEKYYRRQQSFEHEYNDPSAQLKFLERLFSQPTDQLCTRWFLLALYDLPPVFLLQTANRFMNQSSGCLSFEQLALNPISLLEYYEQETLYNRNLLRILMALLSFFVTSAHNLVAKQCRKMLSYRTLADQNADACYMLLESSVIQTLLNRHWPDDRLKLIICEYINSRLRNDERLAKLIIFQTFPIDRIYIRELAIQDAFFATVADLFQQKDSAKLVYAVELTTELIYLLPAPNTLKLAVEVVIPKTKSLITNIRDITTELELNDISRLMRSLTRLCQIFPLDIGASILAILLDIKEITASQEQKFSGKLLKELVEAAEKCKQVLMKSESKRTV